MVKLETSVVNEGSDPGSTRSDDSADVMSIPKISTAPATAPSISSSETGTSRASQPICIGVRKSSSTAARSSTHVESIHCSTVLNRLSLEAKHKYLCASSEPMLYPAASIHNKAHSVRVKMALLLLASIAPCT